MANVIIENPVFNSPSEVLDNPGMVSAEAQFDRFRVKQDEAFESDFEREAKRIESRRVQEE